MRNLLGSKLLHVGWEGKNRGILKVEGKEYAKALKNKQYINPGDTVRNV